MATPSIAAVAREISASSPCDPVRQEAVRAVLDGRDTLAVLPTGSGKSAIYQLAAC